MISETWREIGGGHKFGGIHFKRIVEENSAIKVFNKEFGKSKAKLAPKNKKNTISADEGK